MNLQTTLNRLKFNWAVRAIGKTPPVQPGPMGYMALSMVQHRDVLPYLLAIKSLARFLPPAEVVVVADPTLNAEDRALMQRHVPHMRFREAAEFRRPGIPQGGCWERLGAIAEYASTSYVVQVDADTVAVGPVSDVAAAIADGVSFTLGTEDGQRIQSCEESARWAKTRLDDGQHIQILAESCLDRFDTVGDYRYVRGCAGFAGFARGSIDPDRVLRVSERMGEIMGKRWSDWGTEQFTSDLLVASSPGARILPHPRYCAPHRRDADSVFFHFIGYVRFSTGFYAAVADRVARQLKRAAV